MKIITEKAKASLARLKQQGTYMKHFYDEKNEHIIVHMKMWYPLLDTPLGLLFWHNNDNTEGGYFIPYSQS